MRTIPVDSTDAREQREAEAEQAAAYDAERRRHAEQCRGGWRGEDAHGRPVPCVVCRPHLLSVACRLCSTPYAACTSQRLTRRGPCCGACDHHRTTRSTT